jgi:hypothetical protein
LDGGEELLGFSKGQPQMLNALVVFLQGDDIRHSFLTAIIGAQDELKFDAHGEVPSVG